MRRIAVDTNVLLRMLLRDESAQSRHAVELARTARPFVTMTVLLETEWVLRSVARLPRKKINEHFQSLLETYEIDVERQDDVADALTAHRHGMDLADAMHLFGSTSQTDAFATFDKALVKIARTRFEDTKVELCGENRRD